MDTQEIKNFIKMINDSEFRYAKINEGETTIELSKDAMTFTTTETSPVSSKSISNINSSEITPSITAAEGVQEELEDDYYVVKSPLVGTFYESPSPEADAFVKVGDKVRAGDTLCIVEAMKLMNEIESEINGQVVDILLSNDAPVEYGQPLFKIIEE